ncbi:hypothetical protein Q5P01_018710 [Channa striata]|uniref:MHC class I-like antigen recognition-like domain-containing protein n=1 Tax=Channa striata TaxID=64152 RepID=A0AA88M5E7_CHASR|nr:hypothetical protein Q5P01_018710 [Channa striata]
MMILYVLLLTSQVASPAKHSLKYFLSESPGLTNFPEFVGAAVLDEVLLGYCDSTIKKAEPRQDWVKKIIKDDPQHLEWYSLECSVLYQVFRANINSLKQRLNQTEGVHLLQRMSGCEWDNETGHITGFNQYGYDVLVLLSVCITGLFIWRAKKNDFQRHNENSDDTDE